MTPAESQKTCSIRKQTAAKSTQHKTVSGNRRKPRAIFATTARRQQRSEIQFSANAKTILVYPTDRLFASCQFDQVMLLHQKLVGQVHFGSIQSTEAERLAIHPQLI